MNETINRPWLNTYPSNVKPSINPDEFAHLGEVLETSFSRYSSQVAFHNMGKSLTFSEVDEMSKIFSAYLTGELKMKPGDRIAIQMPNILQYPVIMFGALRAGLIVVNTNPLYTPSEMQHQFVDSGATTLVILANFAHNLEKIIKNTHIKNVIITELGDMIGGLKGSIINFVVKKVKKLVPPFSIQGAVNFKQAMNLGKKHVFSKPSIKNSDIAFLQYTGGTTGVSKGAMLTHRNIVANLVQVNAWMDHGGLQPGKEIFITAIPIYHIFALVCNVMVAANVGAKNVLITNPRDMPGFIKELSKHKFTVITGVNTLFNGLLNQEKFAGLDFSALRFAFGGGMAVQKATAEKWKKVTGSPLCEGYGLTETSPVLTANPLNADGRVGFIGLPVPNTDIKLIDDEGHEVAEGTPGELCAKGPQVMAGYWNKPEETAKVMLGEWFKTGDIAIMDPTGFFKIVDRKKEMILVSGFNVYPNEIEDVIAMHPKVLEVGVIGVPDSKSSEAVKAYIVKKDPSLSEDEIYSHCKEHLTAYKRPKHIAFATELPKSNVGKILRRIIKENDQKSNTYP